MRFSTIAAAAALAALGACAQRTPPPRPAPPPEPVRPAPPPVATVPPPAEAWDVAAVTPGDWTYRRDGGASSATFGGGAAMFALRCEGSREMSLVRPGAAAGSMTVRTSYGVRAVPGALVAGSPRPALVARLAPGDPLLDQIVFSRGRFAVEAPGAARLVLPAWPELARVVEDCR